MLQLKNELFTGREKIVKAVKFRLIPTPDTERTITELKLLQKDAELKAKAEMFKDLYDEYIRYISRRALDHLTFDFSALADIYVKTRDLRQDREERIKTLREYEKKKAELMGAISKKVAELLPKIAKSTMDIMAAGFLNVELAHFLETESCLEDDRKAELRKLFEEGTTGYTVILRKFLRTRVTSLDALMPKRVIENFEEYCNNIPALSVFFATDDGKDFLRDYPEAAMYSDPAYYRYCVTQDQIEAYNMFISGEYDKDGCINKGYNQTVTELNRQHRSDRSYEGAYYRKVNMLSKQILMPAEAQFVVTKIENDEDARKEIRCITEMVDSRAMYVAVAALRSAPRDGILTGKLHEFSHITCGDHQIISDAVCSRLESDIEEEMNKADDTRAGKKLRKELEAKLNSISRMVNRTMHTVAELEEVTGTKDLLSGLVLKLNEDIRMIGEGVSGLDTARIFSEGVKLHGNNSSMTAIKNYLDAIVEFRTDLMLLKPNGDQRADVDFYNMFDDIISSLSTFHERYSRLRNYLVSKAGDIAEEDSCTFGSGNKLEPSWYNNDIPGKLGSDDAAMMKDAEGNYYYIFRTPDARPVSLAPAAEGEESYQILTVKKSSDPVKFLPRILFSKSVKEQFLAGSEEVVITEKMLEGESVTVSRELYDIYTRGLHKKAALTSGIITEEEYTANCRLLIDKYKELCVKYSDYATHFSFSFGEQYELMNFFQYVASRTIDMGWYMASKKSVDDAAARGDLMIFRLYHKDMERKRNLENIDSYLKLLYYMLSDDNFRRHDIALNGSPRLTFRKKAVDRTKVTHPAGSLVVNHRLTDGTMMTKSVQNEVYRYVNGQLEARRLSDEAARIVAGKLYVAHTFNRDINLDNRYTEDRYFIQLSYTRTTENERPRINDDVREKIEGESPNRLILVRGISTMLYWQLRDGNNRLMDEGSFDKLNGIDYKNLLSAYTQEKITAKSEKWEYGVSSASLKEDFLCGAAAKAVKIAVENNALIVIETISDGFKDRTSFIDDSAFRKFDDVLTNKLADYYSKNIETGSLSSISAPLQLSSLKVRSGSIQNGILFRLSNALTRSMCPYTGFVDMFADAPKTISARRQFLSKFREIYPVREEDGSEGYVFRFDFKDFSLRYSLAKDTPSEFSIYAAGPVCVLNRTGGYYEIQDIAAGAVAVLAEENFSGSILDAIKEGKASGKAINAIYDLFTATIRRREVRKCKGNDKTFAVSPAIPFSAQDHDRTRIQINAELLADKFDYFLRYEGKDLMNDWMNDYITRHQQ